MIDFRRVADLGALAAQDAPVQSVLNGLHHAIGLIVGIIVPVGRGEHRHGPHVVRARLHGGANRAAPSAASAPLNGVHLLLGLHIELVDLVAVEVVEAHAVVPCRGRQVALRFVDDEIVQHRIALKRRDIVSHVGQRRDARQLGLAVHHHGAPSAAATVAGVIEGNRLFVLVDVHERLKRRHLVSEGHLECLVVGRGVLGRIEARNGNFHENLLQA